MSGNVEGTIDYIREQDPLKQGLKPFLSSEVTSTEKIREQDPLKQGLKPFGAAISAAIWPDSRARSIKTRIETALVPYVAILALGIREQDPLKQGLKLMVRSLFLISLVFASKIH